MTRISRGATAARGPASPGRLIPYLLLGLLAAATPRPAGAQALILSDPGRITVVEAADALSLIIDAKGLVSEIRTPPIGADLGDLSVYRCVWDLRVDRPLPALDVQRFTAYAQAGGSLYFSGENAGFQARNNSLTAFIGALGGGAPVASTVLSGNNTPVDIFELTNPAHLLSQECEAVTVVDYDGVDNGQFLATGTGTWLTGVPASACAVAWDQGTLSQAPQARVVVALDINWLSPGASGTLDHTILGGPLFPTQNRTYVKNLVSYLCAVSCCPNPAGPRPPRSAASPCSAASSR